MSTAVKTSTTELGDSRVRVEVEVASEALERELETAATAIGREMRVPGFRSGKIPPQVVIRQVGREAVLDEAVRRGLPSWYEQAINDAGLTTVGDPSIDLSDLPEKGSPLAFSIEIGIVPSARLGDYKSLDVPKPDTAADADEVQAELDRLRESHASLDNVERAAADGDFVVMDFVGKIDDEEFEGGAARGHVAELGSGRLIPGFEDQLVGASAGDSVTVSVTFPEDYQAEHLAGRDASFAVEVKEVKEKQLPELDDGFAEAAGGYDSLDELRSELSERIEQANEARAEAEFREAAVDAAVAKATITIPHELVHSKAHEMWHRTSRRLASQGMDPQRYLEFAGKTEEELVTESEPDAELALKREAVLAAIVEAEGIEVTDDEVDEALRSAAPPDASEKQLKRALKRARSQGAEEALREDIAMRKAVDLLVESANPINPGRAEAREKIWTPESADS